MKTVGQILKKARLEKNLSLDHLSSLTRIDAKYIDCLEADNYSSLPSETFIKGFIRNLSLSLELNPDELVAIFRRDFKIINERQSQPKKYHSKKPNISYRHFSSQYALLGLGLFVFVLYLAFQFRAIITPPKLEVVQPKINSVLVSPIEIEGLTTPDSLVTINGETKVKPDLSGHYLARLSLSVGETTLEVSATNRFSRTTTVKIPITVVSK